MADLTEQRNLIGKLSLYRRLDAAPRGFLRRNLTRVLDCHQRELELERHNVNRSDADAVKGPEVNDSRRFASDLFRCLESERMVDQALAAQRLVLVIESLRLRPISERHKRDDVHPSSIGDSLGWIPPVNTFRLSCLITAAVYDRPYTSKNQIFMDLRQGIIVRHDDRDGRATFNIELKESFRIEIDRLSAARAADEAEDDGPSTRDPSMHSSNLELEIGIQFRNSDSQNKVRFLNTIRNGDESLDSTVPTEHCLLRIHWSKLPAVPYPRHMLSLSWATGSLLSSYGAEVKMCWNEPISAIDRVNKTLRKRGDGRQLPTPVSDSHEGPSKRPVIKYLFQQAFKIRSVTTEEFKCILCSSTAEHTSFDRLVLHYTNNHVHFKFEVEESGSQACKIVRVKLADEIHAAPESDSEWLWQAPSKPFDISSHLQGDETWRLRDAKQKSTAKLSTAKTSAVKTKPRAVERIEVARAKRRSIPPEEVADLPTRQRRTNPVPDIPGINFYRKMSKQNVSAGTIISDSDDEIEEVWLAESKHRDLIALALDDISVAFHELFDKHLDEELPVSDSHTRDSLVRFARKFRSQLGDPQWKEVFSKKLHLLETRRVIGKNTTAYCLEIIKANTVPIRDQMKWVRREIEKSSSFHLDGGHSLAGRYIKCRRPRAIGCASGAAVSTLISIPNVLKVQCMFDPEVLKGNIQPAHLEHAHFLEFLNEFPGYHPESDVITHVEGDQRVVIQNQYDWFLALASEQRNPGRDEIVFEILDSREEPEAQQGSESVSPLVLPPARKLERRKALETPPCVCGEQIDGVRGTIGCGNPSCRRDFHMKCVGLDKRPLEWACMKCGS